MRQKGRGQGLGPPPLWFVVGEGRLEGSVDWVGRGSASRPDPAQKERERERVRTEPSSPASLPAGPGPPVPMLGDGGASSFGLRLRTGERCSRRGRSVGYRQTWGGMLRAGRLSSPPPLPTLTCLWSLRLPFTLPSLAVVAPSLLAPIFQPLRTLVAL